MKKISLLSLLVALAVSAGASAGTENPLYIPDAHRAYSITDVTDEGDFRVREHLGYGFSDKFNAGLVFGYSDPENGSHTDKGFDIIGLDLGYRYLSGNIIGDLLGRYETNLEKDASDYGKFNSYTIGTRLGTIKSDYTLAGRALYTYLDPDAGGTFNVWQVGFGGLYQFAPKFSGLLDAEYINYDTGNSDDDPVWLTAQLNFLHRGTYSLYFKTDVSGEADDVWGLKYGVQF
ncbi:MAG: hypothetical protein LBI17_02000 [Rickettsiales bacterium]|jgi:predicted small lipoprotein YifL|nr:hypothetical protein [Rickettsiales bacterium]